ncbi:MAG: bifunctional diaminohydroxyphosphoribosylaminopyrimidine deaminase/5-amino-6-(5-phosphoribosylamino)uracil reductase RibD [Polyangia bacterium]
MPALSQPGQPGFPGSFGPPGPPGSNDPSAAAAPTDLRGDGQGACAVLRPGPTPRAAERVAGERPHDAALMALALAEAERGRGRTSPNPLVGALVVDEGDGDAGEPRVLSRGFHARAGTDHAEVAALRPLGLVAPGKTLYVTLEPCNHIGRTGKCTDAVLAAGIRRVVIGMHDPNPRVTGGGIERLRAAGLEVVVGVGEAQCRHLNRGYLRWLHSGMPHAILKAALSLDGRLAPAGAHAASPPSPQWLTGAEARAAAHVLRDEVDAILIGAGTVLADDPQLTVRLPPAALAAASSSGRASRQPLRVVLDGALRTPATAKLCGPGTVLFTSEPAAAAQPGTVQALADRGVEVIPLPPFRPRSNEILHRPLRPTDISPFDVLARLGERGVLLLLCEGGAELHAVLLELGLYAEAALFLAPVLLGDRGVPLLSGYPVPSVGAAPWLDGVTVQALGRDVLVRGLLRLGGYSPSAPAEPAAVAAGGT